MQKERGHPAVSPKKFGFGRSVTPDISFAHYRSMWRMKTRFSPQSLSVYLYDYCTFFIHACKVFSYFSKTSSKLYLRYTKMS